MRRSKRRPAPVPQVSRFELVLIVKAAIAVSDRTDITFELDPENDDAVVDACWWLTIHTATNEVDFLVSPDGWYFAREDEHGYFEDAVERPRLSEVLRELQTVGTLSPGRMARTEYYNDPDAPGPNSIRVAVSAIGRDKSGRLLMIRRTESELP